MTIVGQPTDQDVIALSADQPVISEPANQRIAPARAAQDVVCFSSLNVVMPTAAVKCGGLICSHHPVAIGTAANDDPAASAADNLPAIKAVGCAVEVLHRLNVKGSQFGHVVGPVIVCHHRQVWSVPGRFQCQAAIM